MKRISISWHLLLPIGILLVLGAVLLMWRESGVEVRRVHERAEAEVADLARLLKVSESLVEDRVIASVALLKARGMAYGTPHIRGEKIVGIGSLPALYLGKTAQVGNHTLPDEVTRLLGGVVSIFVKAGSQFVRVSTNVRSEMGQREMGTLLDPEGPAITMISEGRAFDGVVDILGEPYFTAYEPILNADGKIIGAWGAGYELDTGALREVIEHTRFLQSGFVALVDQHERVRFLSAHAPKDFAQRLVKKSPPDWVVVKKYLPTWRFEVILAYPAYEARTASFAKLGYSMLLMLLLGVGVIAVLSVQMYRLVLNPIGAEPALAAKLMDSIAHGDLDEDGQSAKPNTLMGNILLLRRNLRESFDKLQHVTHQLGLAASVFEHANDGIFITDAQGNIIEINAAFTRLTGYTHSEAVKETLYTLNFSSSKTEVLEDVWPSLSQTGAWHGEIRNLRKTGEAYISSLDIFSVRDAKGAVSHYVGVIADITKLKQQQQHLEHMAYHDALTHLPNRILLSDRLQLALSRLGRSSHLLALCLLDLDGFKPVNDKLGHEAGDYLLVELAQRLTASLRSGDTVARLGGDEFAILLCDLNNFEECQLAIQRLLSAIATPFKILGNEVRVSGSIGLTISPFEDKTPDTLLRHADQAMYQAKIRGGNCYEVFDSGHERRTRAHHEALENIEVALRNGELQLHYQPKVDMQSGEVMGAEGLIRWQHARRGMLLPAEFLPTIEATEFAVVLGGYVIQQALGQMDAWQQQGLNLVVSVNISARHVSKPYFAEQLAAHLQSWPRVSPSKLKLEITESTVIGDIAHVAKTIEDCRQLGVEFVLDDFGTGYSSLTYLHRLSAQMLKIDQSFVRDMLIDDNALAIVQGVISLGAAFKRGVIAEGVESAEQAAKLVQMGCYLGQGYGIAKPMPAQDIPAWVRAYKRN